MSPSPAPAAASLHGALLAALLLLAPARADDADPLLYAMNDRGLLSIGGTVLESLPSKYDPNNSPVLFPEQQWIDLVVVGADRHVLRLDGRVEKNGAKLHTLPFDDEAGTGNWIRLGVSTEVYALRDDGMLARGSDASQVYPDGGLLFLDMLAPPDDVFPEGPDAFALRIDGSIFGGSSPTPGIKLVGGPGVTGTLDGVTPDTWWGRLARDPTTGEVYALRADGIIHKFDPLDFEPVVPDPGGEPPPPPPAGELVAELPFPDGPVFLPGDIYLALVFDEDGTWYALRTDGAVFSSDDEETPLVDLPGDGLDTTKAYVDLAVLDGCIWTLRFDGLLYAGTEQDPIIDLTKKRYVRMATSTVAPDLSNTKNAKPKAALYKVKLLEDEGFTLPIILSDVDLAADELIVEVDLTLLPGADWDPDLREVTWDGDVAGKYRFEVSVDDGQLKKPKVFKYSVKVLTEDVNELKNRKPTPSKVKTVQALVGYEVRIPILATDRDLDDLTYSVDETVGIFAQGATFETDPPEICWTPEFEHIGKWSAPVQISDGIKTKVLKVKFKVVNPLIF